MICCKTQQNLTTLKELCDPDGFPIQPESVLSATILFSLKESIPNKNIVNFSICHKVKSLKSNCYKVLSEVEVFLYAKSR